MASDLTKLVEFIASAKARNVTDEFTASLLRQNGWSDRRIYQAFSSYYQDTVGLKIPSRGTRLEYARDAFYYLLTFIALGFWTVALVMFAYAYIDHVLQSALDYQYVSMSFRSQVADQLATLIIAFPLFLFMSRLVAQETARRPEAFESGVRKWLTYVALVITAVTLLSDGVWFLSTYLSGDLTSRFALEAATLFSITVGIFWYYLGTVRADAINPQRDWAFAAAAAVAVAAALVLGFTSIGSPAQQRTVSLDDERVSRLWMIANAIHARFTEAVGHGSPTLPPTLAGMPDLTIDQLSDPVTHVPFQYFPMTGTLYRLCGVFDGSVAPTPTIYFWYHSAGSTCFTLDARGVAPSTVH